MSDPSDYTAKIRAKGLDATGVTEQLAAEMYRNKGRHYMVIAEVKVDETHEKADGNRKVDLVLTLVEPATDSALEEHLRELTRVGYLNRQQSDGQLAIDQSLGAERTVADVLSSGGKFKPHPFIVVDASVENPICDVCGGIEASAVHSRQDVLDDAVDEEDEPHEFTPYGDLDACRLCGRLEHDDPGIHVSDAPNVDKPTDEPTEDDVAAAAEPVDPYVHVHAKGGSLPGEETICALHATIGKSLHTHDDHDQVTCPDCLEQLTIDASFEADDAAASTDATANPDRHLSSVSDPFTAPATAGGIQ